MMWCVYQPCIVHACHTLHVLYRYLHTMWVFCAFLQTYFPWWVTLGPPVSCLALIQKWNPYLLVMKQCGAWACSWSYSNRVTVQARSSSQFPFFPLGQRQTHDVNKALNKTLLFFCSVSDEQVHLRIMGFQMSKYISDEQANLHRVICAPLYIATTKTRGKDEVFQKLWWFRLSKFSFPFFYSFALLVQSQVM